jgi:hypothetical protein
VKKLTYLIGIWVLMGIPDHAAAASANDASAQLTVELRDGSRVIGTPVEASLSFHSATLGDVKLPWAGIRKVEYSSDNGVDTAHLTAVNGDAFTVQLSIDTLRLTTGFGPTELPLKLVRSIQVASLEGGSGLTASGASHQGDLRLTIDLRDGSHLVGKGLDDTLNFHSAAMGDLKLTWSGVRSVEFTAKDTDAAQLTAINGDVYEVQFGAPTVKLETSFGKNEVPVKLIDRISVSTDGDGGEHLVGWWKLDEGTGTVVKDSSSGPSPHDGTLVNGPTWTQELGRTQMSLQFNGANQYVSLGNILQGSYTEISIASWVKHSGNGVQTIVERSIWDNSDGLSLCAGDTVQFGHYGLKVFSKASLQDGQWHHVVGTMSPSDPGYLYSIYIDGKLDNTVTSPMGLTATSNGWGIGACYDGTWSWRGSLADVRIYDHALSASEVEAIYEEQRSNYPSLPSPPALAPSPSVQPVEATFNGNTRQGVLGTLDK